MSDMPSPDLEAFAVSLASRPDAPRVRAILARAFIDNRATMLLPADPQWIADNVDAILGTMIALFAEAAGPPPSSDWLKRNAWLPAIVSDIEAGRGQLDS